MYRLEDSVLKFLTVRVKEKDLQAAAVETVESGSGGV